MTTEPDANGWYPIESAPHPTDKILDLWIAHIRLGIGRLEDCMHIAESDVWVNVGNGGNELHPLQVEGMTHWRYPPKPPVEFEEKK